MDNHGATTQDSGSVFEQNRKRLWGIAYRMLGSRADAEDMLQETYLRWHRAPAAEIRSPQAWLVTAITRLSVDRLRRLRTERAAYVGPWLPEPLVGELDPPADVAAELASSLSVAFLALLERLAPQERAAFLLHEVFDSGYDDIAGILGKSELACRQIVSRARKRVREARPRTQVNASARTELLQALMTAMREGDQNALVELFAEDASWTADGGGKVFAARKAVVGRERIARFIVRVFGRMPGKVEYRSIMVNDEPGIAMVVDGKLFSILFLQTDGVRILDVYNIVNPEKLRGVTLGS